MTLQVISKASVGCSPDLVSKAKDWYLQIQLSTGLNCITPTNLGVCQNGGHCIDSPQSYNCACPPQYGGLTCSQGKSSWTSRSSVACSQ